ncbi:MAG: TetR/AcrR family transcriptional regulator [Mobilitalea sp.]
MDSKQQFLKAAFRLFSQNSYKAVTLRKIIKEANLSNGSFYYHFISKEQIFKEVIQVFLYGMSDRILENRPEVTLFQYIQNKLESIQKEYSRLEIIMGGDLKESDIYFLTYEAIRYFPELREETMKYQLLEIQSWINVIDNAKKQEEIKSYMDNEIIAKLFVYVQDGDNLNRFIFNINHKQLLGRISLLWESIYNSLKAT